jgi:hypothetical protein
MPNFSAGPMRINLSLSHFEDLTVTTDDPIVELNAWHCEVVSLAGKPIAMPELGFLNSGVAHQLHWASAPVDTARFAALWLALLTRRTLRIRIGYDLHQSQELTLQLLPITFAQAAAPSSAP